MRILGFKVFCKLSRWPLYLVPKNWTINQKNLESLTRVLKPSILIDFKVLFSNFYFSILYFYFLRCYFRKIALKNSFLTITFFLLILADEKVQIQKEYPKIYKNIGF